MADPADVTDDSSGDVIIEQCSEGESDDVIFVESSSDKSRDFVVEHVDSDSDSDCVILEKDSSIDKDFVDENDGRALDCDSFEEFKRESVELVTSTPKHNQDESEAIPHVGQHNIKQIEHISHTSSSVVETSEVNQVDTDSSDDTVVIIGDVTGGFDEDIKKKANDSIMKAFTGDECELSSRGALSSIPKFIKNAGLGVYLKTKPKACKIVEDNHNEEVEVEKHLNDVGLECSDAETTEVKQKPKLMHDEIDGVKDHEDNVKKNIAQKRVIDETAELMPVVKKPCFVFGSTAVLPQEQFKQVTIYEEVSLSEQLAMSSEEEEDGQEDEKGEDYWIKMISGTSSGKVDEKEKPCLLVISDGVEEKEQVQAWSAQEESKPETKIRTAPVDRKQAEVIDESKLEDNEEDSDDDDKISLAPSLDMLNEDEELASNGKCDQNNNEEDDNVSDDDIGLAIYSLGNYCKRMLRGVLCSKPRCSWVHYMEPSDAVMQFFRICSNRSVKAVLRFYRFFTNLEVQAQMVTDAQELLAKTDPGEVMEIDPKQVCRAVFKAMVKVSNGLDLTIDQYMEMVEISASLYSTQDGKDTLVSLFSQTSNLVADAGPHPAIQRLVRWSWTSLYLSSLSHGVVLAAKFYTDFCNLLVKHKMIPQLVEVLLYTSLIPSLTPPLIPLYEVLASPPEILTDSHSTAILTAQTLSHLCISDWVSLSKLGDIKPGTIILAQTLKNDQPSDVYKFYDALPEIPGLNIPDVPPPPPTNLDFWLGKKLTEGEWEEVVHCFCSIQQNEVEDIADFAEKILLEVSKLCGQYQLREPIPALYAAMIPTVISRQSEVHTQLFRQLGVALMICMVTSTQWGEASVLVKLLANQLQSDFLCVKPPPLSQFSGLHRGMVPLFVLEILVWTKQRLELLKYLELWDCLASLETALEVEKRNTILTSVLECLTNGNVDETTLEIMIRVNEVMAPGMKNESNPVIRRRQETMSNILFQKMLNMNLSGSRLWAVYKQVRSCNHQLDKDVNRGIVMMLAYSRMLPQAIIVYKSAIRWGVYSTQALTRPLTLRLASSLAMEEIYVIVVEFLNRVEEEMQKESLNIFVKMEETSTSNTTIKHLNCVRSKKTEAMGRVEKVLCMLEPPLELSQASVPFISEQLVRRYLVLKQVQ